jgi:arginyl-tRNA synthetase
MKHDINKGNSAMNKAQSVIAGAIFERLKPLGIVSKVVITKKGYINCYIDRSKLKAHHTCAACIEDGIAAILKTSRNQILTSFEGKCK